MENIILPAGIILNSSYISSAVASQLFAYLEKNSIWKQEKIQFGDKEVPLPRLTSWVGEEDAIYSYSGIKNTPEPWDNILSSLRVRLQQDMQTSFNSVLINFYRSGADSIGWHSDDEPELGGTPTIASISLGGVRNFLLRPVGTKKATHTLALPHGSLLVMSGETQKNWQHSIAKESENTPRINLTFRNIIKPSPRLRNNRQVSR